MMPLRTNAGTQKKIFEQLPNPLRLLILNVLNIEKPLKANKSQMTKIRNAMRHSVVSEIQLPICNAVISKNE